MDPNQQYPGMQQPGQPAPQQNPYGFILDAQKQPKKPFMPSGNSFQSRIMLLIGGAVALIIVIIVASSLFFGSGDNNAELLRGLSAEQQEIVRIADLGIKATADPDTLAYAQTAKLSVMSQQAELLGYLSTKNTKVTPLQLAANKNEATDKAFTSAQATNRFDETFLASMRASLEKYSLSLKNNFQKASNPTSREILGRSYESTAQLLK